MKAGAVIFDGPACLTALHSLSLDGPSLPPEAWACLTQLTRLHMAELRVGPATLPCLMGMPRLSCLSVLGLEAIHGPGLRGVTSLAYLECCHPATLVVHLQDSLGPVLVTHLRMSMTRSGGECTAIRKLLSGGAAAMIYGCQELDLDMASDAGMEHFGRASQIDELALSALALLGGSLRALSLSGFHLAPEDVARISLTFPLLERVALRECWLLPSALGSLHSLPHLSRVVLRSCLGSGVGPKFLVAFAAYCPRPVLLQMELEEGFYGNEEEWAAEEMQGVIDMLANLRPDAVFNWNWVID